MKRKRDIKTREIHARINLDGSSMTKGKHYDQTYAPVARWKPIRLLLSMSALHGWHTTQIDYVPVFPQVPVERELYMQLPREFEIAGAKPGEYLFRLNKNVYGQKSAGRVWNRYLTEKLTKEVGFIQSKTDDCVFFKGNAVYLFNTDDSILAGPSKKEIKSVIQAIKDAGLNITVEGDMQELFEVNIERKTNGIVYLTQPHLIDSILDDLRMLDDVLKTKRTPASSYDSQSQLLLIVRSITDASLGS
jgi:Reverse transcriptase (RNA-dependent DNA polymerase)